MVFFCLHCRELHAFLYDAVVLDYLGGQDDGCKLRVVGNWYAMTGYGIGFPKKSKYKDMINKEIIDMHHSGFRINFSFSCIEKNFFL